MKFNKRIKRFIAMCLSLVLICGMMCALPLTVSAEGSGKCGDDLEWSLDDYGTLTISGTGDMWDFDYQESPWYSQKESIFNVKLSDTVTSIGGYAFQGCGYLASITIPDGVTKIGVAAFERCISLAAIDLSDSITYFDYGVFEGTAYYKQQSNWKDGVLYIGNHLIKAKVKGSYSVRAGTKTILSDAFHSCSDLTEITFPEELASIGIGAFSNCVGLTSVTIPDGVSTIGRQAFEYCVNLKSISLPSSLTSIESGLFYGCRQLSSVTIPSGVTKIENHAFFNCMAIKTLTLPKSVTDIQLRAFENCVALSEINIPDGVTEIGDFTFAGCAKLKSIIIPDSVTTISGSAFAGCTSLTLYGSYGSYAQKYTSTGSIPFKAGVIFDDMIFTDMKPNEWFVDAVRYAVGHGLFYGISDTLFAPSMAMNRAMLVAVLWRMEERPTVSGENPFGDVPSGQWYTDAVQWAVSNGVVYGVSNDKFDPMGNVTREQVATILYRYSQKKGYDVGKSADLNAFPDGDKTSDYAVTALSWAYGEGFITGVKKGDVDYLEPKGSATRAQIASILMRYQQNIAK